MTTMLEALKFVQGSIAKKELVDELTHFQIKNGRVSGYNGVIALSSPIPFDLNCNPKAAELIKAISNCDENDTIQLSLTPGGKLTVKSAGFRVNIQSFNEPVHSYEPEGEVVEFDGEAFLQGVKAVSPFIGQDASRKWSQGVLIKDSSFFATNNVTLVQYWLGAVFPFEINIPMPTVKEILRIKEAPLSMQVAENCFTLHYSGDRWLRSQYYSIKEWPDLGKILDRPFNPGPLDPAVFVGLEKMKSFVDPLGSIYFQGGLMTTHPDVAEANATFAVPSIQTEGLFNNQMLALLEGVATHIDWTTYPAPCLFSGDRLRGAIVGMRK